MTSPAPRRSHPPRLIALLLVLLLTVAACGGEDDPAVEAVDPTAEDAAAATDAEAQEPTEDAAAEGDATEAEAPAQTDAPAETLSLTFQPATESMAVLTQLVAFAGGFFEEEGLDITYNTPIPNAAQAAQSVTGPNADIAIVGSSGAASAVGAGLDIVSVATLTKGATTQLTLRDDVIAELGVDVDAPIEERVQALAGLTLGLPTPGSLTDVVTRQSLAQYGVNPDADVTIRPINETPALVTAIREGQVDGIAFSAPVSVQPVAEGYGTVWFSLAAGDIPAYEALPFIDVVVQRSYLEENTEAVTRFVAALQRASDLLIEDPEAAAALIKPEYFADLDQATFDLAFDVTVPAAQRSLIPEQEGFDVLVELVNATSDQPIDITFEQLYDTSVVEEVGAS